MAGLAVSLLPRSRRILSLRREIESLSANSGFSLHLVGFAAVAERDETATNGRRDDDFRVKRLSLREKSLRGGGKEQSLRTRGTVIGSGFGSKDIIFNKNPRGFRKRSVGDNEERERESEVFSLLRVVYILHFQAHISGLRYNVSQTTFPTRRIFKYTIFALGTLET
jgi:hypothetical protein